MKKQMLKCAKDRMGRCSVKERKKVSMKQIAEQLSVSLGTVSLVLNGRGDEMRISAETQKLILDTAKKQVIQVQSTVEEMIAEQARKCKEAGMK